MRPGIIFDYCGKSDQGLVRKNNEDANVCVFADAHRRFLLVAAIDGVGGYEGGEIAASIVASTLEERIKAEAENLEGHKPEITERALAEANNRVIERKDAESRLDEMGAVATCALFDTEKAEVCIAHVGDTRAYVFCEGHLRKLTRDHSPVGELEDDGRLSEHEAMHHPHRNIISRMIGDERHMAGDGGFIDCITFNYGLPSIFLFCSDGLTDMVDSDFIAGILANKALTAEQKTDALIAEAIRIEGRDNITAVVVECSRTEDTDTTIPTTVVRRETGVIYEDGKADVKGHGRADSGLKLRRVIFVLSIIVALLAGFIAGLFTGVKYADSRRAIPAPTETNMTETQNNHGQE